MKSIYGKARVVRVWLREEVDGRDNAIHLLSQMADMEVLSEDQELDCAFRFLTRLWWNRIWAVAEVLLAKAATMHCGNTFWDYKRFQKTILSETILNPLYSRPRKIGDLAFQEAFQPIFNRFSRPWNCMARAYKALCRPYALGA